MIEMIRPENDADWFKNGGDLDVFGDLGKSADLDSHKACNRFYVSLRHASYHISIATYQVLWFIRSSRLLFAQELTANLLSRRVQYRAVHASGQTHGPGPVGSGQLTRPEPRRN